MSPPIWHHHDFILYCVQREEAGEGPCPFSESTTEAIAQKALNVADTAPRVPMGQYPPSPGLPLDRAQLKREIHAQLKRVGCYRGAIDGQWSSTVRRSTQLIAPAPVTLLPV